MKRMNEEMEKRVSLKDKVLQDVGDWFIRMAVSPRGCVHISTYEPNVPDEILMEMSIEKENISPQ